MVVVVAALLAAVYELVAIGSWNRLPTITTLVRRHPVGYRVAGVALFALLLADHFTTEIVP